jgi:hypothetical protein
MSEREHFTFEGVDVTVEESADALTYTFRPSKTNFRPGFPLIILLVFTALPLGLLAVTAYAYSKLANRPEWELALVGVFAVQLLAWFAFGAARCYLVLRWWYRPFGIVLKFTHTHIWHGGGRVCELADLRGLRLFAHPATGEHADQRFAALSLVIGADEGTHGLFGGTPEQSLRTFAEGLHRRIMRFRENQGLMTALEPLAVVETTEDGAAKLSHTRPARGSITRAMNAAGYILINRWAGIVWCASMIAGLAASAQMILAAGLSPAFLVGHATIGMFHFLLLSFHLEVLGRKPKKRHQREPRPK